MNKFVKRVFSKNKCSKRGFVLFLFSVVLIGGGVYAQFGIRVGVNMANEFYKFEKQSDAFSSKNLTGYQIGVVYQSMPDKSGLGCEIGLSLAQKGSSFSRDSINETTPAAQGYREWSYVEMPFNMRYRLTLGFVGVYGIAGVYGAYAFNGRTVNEITNDIKQESFATFSDHLDYGYTLGAGLELFNKVQLGAVWSRGLKNTTSATVETMPSNTTNKVFSIQLVYLF